MPTLRPYQDAGVTFLRSRTSALLLDDQGLGKTPQALVATGAQAVAVVPAVVKGSWVDECLAWRKDLRPVVLQGRGSFRWPRAGELVVTNYEVLPPCMAEATALKKRIEEKEEKNRLLGLLPMDDSLARDRAKLDELRAAIKAIGKPLPGTDLLADEAHRLASNKTSQTKRFRALRRVVAKAGGHTYGFTGTPLLNRPIELWNLLTSFGLQQEAFGSWPAFCRAFGAQQGRFGMVWGKPTDAVPQGLAKVAKRRLKKHVLRELPDKTYRVVRVELDRQARAVCDAAASALAGLGVDLEHATRMALETAEQGAAFETMSRARMALATAKVSAALELIEEFEAQEIPLVVLSAHRAAAIAVGAKKGWASIHGGVAAADRSDIVRRFQAGELRGVALTIRAGGVGITLTRASNVLRIDRDWTPGLNRQAEDRVHRFGQRDHVVVTDLVADHALDVRMAEVCLEKDELAAAVDAMADAGGAG